MGAMLRAGHDPDLARRVLTMAADEAERGDDLRGFHHMAMGEAAPEEVEAEQQQIGGEPRW